MNAQEFVDAVRAVVVESTAPDLVALLRRPPGRKPAAEIVELSAWFNGLSEHDKVMAEKAMNLAVRHAVFGVFAVLDGSTAVQTSWSPGDHFELSHVQDGQRETISGPKGSVLHELL